MEKHKKIGRFSGRYGWVGEIMHGRIWPDLEEPIWCFEFTLFIGIVSSPIL